MIDANDVFTARTVAESKVLLKALQQEKDLTSTKMTRKVLQNYKLLIETSKDVTSMYMCLRKR